MATGVKGMVSRWKVVEPQRRPTTRTREFDVSVVVKEAYHRRRRVARADEGVAGVLRAGAG